jgi:hypothetical protein
LSQIGNDVTAFKQAKSELNERLRKLNDSLNHKLYDSTASSSTSHGGLKYEEWLDSHQPFHWLAEFYQIIHGNGGFDVVIGNPPYVGIREIDYTITNFTTIDSGDVYSLCVERSASVLLGKVGKMGMIVPISIISTDEYSSLRKVLCKSRRGFYFSNLGVRPSKLFDGVDKRLTIFISTAVDNCYYATKYHRWTSLEREILFSKIEYESTLMDIMGISGFPKLSADIQSGILKKLRMENATIADFAVKHSTNFVQYTRKLQYFIQFFETPPAIYNRQGDEVEPTELKQICFRTIRERDIAIASLNSSLFFWFFVTFADCRNVNSREIIRFPIALNKFENELSEQLIETGKELLVDLKNNSIFVKRNDKRAGLLDIQSFQPRFSKPIIDKIDRLLAQHYGFTEEELDFIINYDIKYRMGDEINSDEE